jgi:phosphatidylinositol-3-phosphatase
MRTLRGSGRSLLIAAAAALALAALSTTATAGSSSDNPQAAGHLKHVFVIMLENHSKNGVIGDPNTPYITSLANEYGLAQNYYGVTHPSEPNYVAMIAGDNFGINNDDPANRYDAPNLIDQLEATGHTWGGYMESMPSVGYTGDFWPSSGSPLYASKHNPFVLFNDIRTNPDRLAKIKPFTSLSADLNGQEKSIPDFVYIVPNQCHDMHGGVYSTVGVGDGTPCPYGSTNNDANDASLKQKADAFVQQAVATITASKAWSGNSAIFVVADESDYNGNSSTGGWADASGCCDSPFVAAGSPSISPAWPGGVYGGGLSPAVVVTTNGPRHYVSSTPYNHYSLLTTIEQNWHLRYLGHAGDTAGGVLPMNDLLGR